MGGTRGNRDRGKDWRRAGENEVSELNRDVITFINQKERNQLKVISPSTQLLF